MLKIAQPTSPPASLNLFTALKPIRFLENLKQLRFSGELVLTGSKGQQWSFYFFLGSIMYATGGIHPVRRWQRNLAAYCPKLPIHSSVLQHDLATIPAEDFKTCWEYQLLCLWVTQQKITPEQAAQIIRAVIIEVLFDVVQVMDVTHQIRQDSSLLTQLNLIDVQQVIVDVQQLWKGWLRAKVRGHSFDSAPTIKHPDELQKRTSERVYQTLTYLLNGQRSLRDLAVLMKRDVVQVTRSLLPYIQSGLVELINIPDLASPVSCPIPKTPTTSAKSKDLLIACVDDSPLVCQTMEALITAAGYQFVSVEDGLRAFGILLARKPDAIFLDLIMPNTNGYEICAKLRQLDEFRNTPIVILTGNDGIVDRVRAKLVGASDFLSKPIDAGIVLSILCKHLERSAASR